MLFYNNLQPTTYQSYVSCHYSLFTIMMSSLALFREQVDAYKTNPVFNPTTRPSDVPSEVDEACRQIARTCKVFVMLVKNHREKIRLTFVMSGPNFETRLCIGAYSEELLASWLDDTTVELVREAYAGLQLHVLGKMPFAVARVVVFDSVTERNKPLFDAAHKELVEEMAAPGWTPDGLMA